MQLNMIFIPLDTMAKFNWNLMFLSDQQTGWLVPFPSTETLGSHSMRFQQWWDILFVTVLHHELNIDVVYLIEQLHITLYMFFKT